MLIIAGIFIGAVFLHNHIQAWWPEFPGGEDGTKAATWLAALLVSFPLLVAVWRKIEAGAMLVAETAVGIGKTGSEDSGLQAVISSTILVFGTGILVLLVALLSSTLLPSRNVLLITLVVMAIASFLLYRGAVKLYSRAQSALRDTFAQPADRAAAEGSPKPPTPFARSTARNRRNPRRHGSRRKDDRRAEAAHPDRSKRRWHRTPWHQHRESRIRTKNWKAETRFF